MPTSDLNRLWKATVRCCWGDNSLASDLCLSTFRGWDQAACHYNQPLIIMTPLKSMTFTMTIQCCETWVISDCQSWGPLAPTTVPSLVQMYTSSGPILWCTNLVPNYNQEQEHPPRNTAYQHQQLFIMRFHQLLPPNIVSSVSGASWGQLLDRNLEPICRHQGGLVGDGRWLVKSCLPVVRDV